MLAGDATAVSFGTAKSPEIDQTDALFWFATPLAFSALCGTLPEGRRTIHLTVGTVAPPDANVLLGNSFRRAHQTPRRSVCPVCDQKFSVVDGIRETFLSAVSHSE